MRSLDIEASARRHGVFVDDMLHAVRDAAGVSGNEWAGFVAGIDGAAGTARRRTGRAYLEERHGGIVGLSPRHTVTGAAVGSAGWR